jgi:hypothetical protein
MNSTKRSLILRVKEGKKAVNSTGVVDSRLFNGNNALYAIYGPGNLWRLEYAHGAIPPALAQNFTNFTLLLKTVKEYLDKRNIEIEKIEDVWK